MRRRSRQFTIDTVRAGGAHNGTFEASTYLTRWNGSFAAVGPVMVRATLCFWLWPASPQFGSRCHAPQSIYMEPFANTRCSGSFSLLSRADRGALDLTCEFLRDDLLTVDTTCQVTYVAIGAYHYYFYMLLWNVVTTVGFVGCLFLSLLVVFVWFRDLDQWRAQKAQLTRQLHRAVGAARSITAQLHAERGDASSDSDSGRRRAGGRDDDDDDDDDDDSDAVPPPLGAQVNSAKLKKRQNRKLQSR